MNNKNKVVTGTKDLGKRQGRVLKAVGGNVQKIRCPGCQTLAHPQPDGKGGTRVRCAGCGREFGFSSM